jgi:archaellin
MRKVLVAVLAAALMVGASGCASTQQAVKETVEQGIEPTSAGTHNTAPANAAQNAVDKVNTGVDQTQQGLDDLGQ